MRGAWHYTEAERLLTEGSGEPLLLQRALVHATLAAAAANTVNAFLDDDEPDAWLKAFEAGHVLEAEIVETPEQSAAIVDANLARMGVTLGGEQLDGDWPETCGRPKDAPIETGAS
jgi:hypothetical protein